MSRIVIKNLLTIMSSIAKLRLRLRLGVWLRIMLRSLNSAKDKIISHMMTLAGKMLHNYSTPSGTKLKTVWDPASEFTRNPKPETLNPKP
jgi:hypothetical protein